MSSFFIKIAAPVPEKTHGSSLVLDDICQVFLKSEHLFRRRLPIMPPKFLVHNQRQLSPAAVLELLLILQILCLTFSPSGTTLKNMQQLFGLIKCALSTFPHRIISVAATLESPLDPAIFLILNFSSMKYFCCSVNRAAFLS